VPESEANINGFLYQFKYFATSGGFRFIERDKNLRTLAELGILEPHAVKEIIMPLTHRNYVKGPEQDRDYPKHNVWVFQCNYEVVNLYIKLSDNFSKNLAICISMHR